MATKRQTKRRRCRIFMAEKRRRRGRQERKKHCPEGTSANPPTKDRSTNTRFSSLFRFKCSLGFPH